MSLELWIIVVLVSALLVYPVRQYVRARILAHEDRATDGQLALIVGKVRNRQGGLELLVRENPPRTQRHATELLLKLERLPLSDGRE